MSDEIFLREAKRRKYQLARQYKPRAPKERVSWFARKPEPVAPQPEPIAAPQPFVAPQPAPVITAPPKRRWWKFWN